MGSRKSFGSVFIFLAVEASPSLGTAGTKLVHEVAVLEDDGVVKLFPCELEVTGRNDVVANVADGVSPDAEDLACPKDVEPKAEVDATGLALQLMDDLPDEDAQEVEERVHWGQGVTTCDTAGACDVAELCIT